MENRKLIHFGRARLDRTSWTVLGLLHSPTTRKLFFCIDIPPYKEWGRFCLLAGGNSTNGISQCSVEAGQWRGEQHWQAYHAMHRKDSVTPPKKRRYMENVCPACARRMPGVLPLY